MTGQPNPQTKPIILMADDDEDDCILAEDAFKESKARGVFLCVGDGIELLEYLSHTGEHSKENETSLPDLILLDLNMPRKNGRQALQEIKAIPAFQHIPIVVLTTSREKKDIVFCRKMGAEDFITKPTLFSQWVEIMNSFNDTWLQKDNRSNFGVKV